MKNMPTLTEEHRALNVLAGRWSGKEKISPSPWDQGGDALGRVENRLALDGFAVVQDYEQERGGKVNFRGHAVFMWDAGQRKYLCYWFDSMGFPPTPMVGDAQGKVFTLSNDTPQGKSRATFDFSQAGRYRFRMEVSQDGKQWFPFMEGDYAKQG